MKFKDIEIRKNKNRKKISFEISSHGDIIIKAPERCSKKYLEKIYEENYDSIIEKYNLLKNDRNLLKLDTGFKIPYRGGKLTIEIRIAKGNYEINNQKLILNVGKHDKELIREKFIEFLRSETGKVVMELVDEYSDFFEDKINNIKIKKQEKRWGSCSSRGNLNFNYDLILMEEEFIRYVVVHELCHLYEMNHSSKFWALLQEFIPDYKMYRNIRKSVFY